MNIRFGSYNQNTCPIIAEIFYSESTNIISSNLYVKLLVVDHQAFLNSVTI